MSHRWWWFLAVVLVVMIAAATALILARTMGPPIPSMTRRETCLAVAGALTPLKYQTPDERRWLADAVSHGVSPRALSGMTSYCAGLKFTPPAA